MAQAEYEREAIDWSYITFVDNQDVLDLIERKPLGILDILDECCRFPRVGLQGLGFLHTLASPKVSPGLRAAAQWHCASMHAAASLARPT